MIGFITCGKSKRPERCKAKHLYSSPLSKNKQLYLKVLYPNIDIYILSAKHGVLNLDDVIDPYDTELPRRDCEQKTLWKTKVLKQLKQFDNDEDIIFLGAKHYYEPINEYFKGSKIAPLLGLTPVCQNVKLLEGINGYYDSKKRRLF